MVDVHATLRHGQGEWALWHAAGGSQGQLGAAPELAAMFSTFHMFCIRVWRAVCGLVFVALLLFAKNFACTVGASAAPRPGSGKPGRQATAISEST